MKNRIAMYLSTVILVLVVTAGCQQPVPASSPSPAPAPTPAPKPAPVAVPKLPAVVVLAAGTPTTGQGARMIAIVEAASRFSPTMKIRIEPKSTDQTIVAAGNLGEVEFVNAAGPTMLSASMGEMKELGKVRLHRVWNGAPFLVGFATRGNSGVKSFADVKGKRVPQTPAAPAWSGNQQAFLAFGGLSLKDVSVVTVPSIAAGLSGLAEGTIDVVASTPFAPAVVEMAASPHGLFWLQVPPDNAAGWKRLREFRPANNPIKTAAAGIKPGETIWAMGYEEGIWARPDVPDEVVYAFAQAVKDSYSVYKERLKELEHWNWERAYSLDGLLNLPYHTGFIKLLKDKGVWTAAHDKFQENALKLEKERLGK